MNNKSFPIIDRSGCTMDVQVHSLLLKCVGEDARPSIPNAFGYGVISAILWALPKERRSEVASSVFAWFSSGQGGDVPESALQIIKSCGDVSIPFVLNSVDANSESFNACVDAVFTKASSLEEHLEMIDMDLSDNRFSFTLKTK